MERFEWDEDKAAANARRHAVGFEEALTVFEDPLYLVFEDPDHSSLECRYVIVGRSGEGRLLLVAYTERAHRIRVIRAREATKRERKTYEEGI